jgi:site-specific DNA recombinase
MRNIIAYVRVSTEEQAREGVSLEAQSEKIALWANLHAPGMQVVVFADEGISGSTLRRPGLERALFYAESLPNSVLVVYSLSRLSRSTKDTLALAARLEQASCELVSLSEHIDTTTAAGKMVFRMLAVLAEFERDQISDRTKLAMRHLRKTGQRFTRYDPYPDSVAKRALEIRNEYGYSYRAIGRRLMLEGIDPQNSKFWSATVVGRLVKRAEAM